MATEVKLEPPTGTATRAEQERFQRKTGSILFAAIITRPDVAFACSQLARFNTNPDQSHHEAADRVLKYLHRTRGYAIEFDGQKDDKASLICASDASFADNPDRKSSQGYIMTVFGGPVAWKANKQDTVTTSSTEAELLALSQTAKEAIFLNRLLKALPIQTEELPTIQCDNRQTLRLLTEESAKLVTKLRHVDIHTHWLRQEAQEKRIKLEWVSTANMPADGFTKPLGAQKHEAFRKMIGLTDETERLDREERMEALRDKIRTAKLDEEEEELIISSKGKAMRRYLQSGPDTQRER